MDYQIEKVSVRLKTRPVQYNQDCRPDDMSVYPKFDKEFKDRAVYDIWEMSIPNSQGWLGVVDNNGDKVVEGEFKTYAHTGPYSGLMEACKTIAMDNPGLTEFYCIYLNSPDNTPEPDLKTKVILR